MNNLLILTSTLGCEVGVGAFASISKEICVHQMTPKDAENSDIVFKEIYALCSKNFSRSVPLTVLMIGTYWKETLLDITRAIIKSTIEKFKLVAYCFGSAPKSDADIVTWIGQSDDPEQWKGPMKYLTEFLPSKGYDGTLIKYYFQSHEPAIHLIDDRLKNRNIMETQSFQNGIDASGPPEESLYDKFRKYFSGSISFASVMTIGRSITDYQMSIVQGRALNNAKQITTNDGIKIVITEAPELINFTHDELHRRFKDASLTAIVNIKFGKNNQKREEDDKSEDEKSEDEIGFSFRSYDPNVDASTYAKKLPQGDGSKTSAGGRAKTKIPYPF